MPVAGTVLLALHRNRHHITTATTTTTTTTTNTAARSDLLAGVRVLISKSSLLSTEDTSFTVLRVISLSKLLLHGTAA